MPTHGSKRAKREVMMPKDDEIKASRMAWHNARSRDPPSHGHRPKRPIPSHESCHPQTVLDLYERRRS